MIPVPVTFTDAHGVVLIEPTGTGRRTIVRKLEGWFGGATIRNNLVERLGDGLFAAPTLRGGRKLTLGVTEWFDTETDTVARARQISGAFPTGTGAGTLTVTTNGVDMTAIGCVLDGEPRITHDLDRMRVDWELPLIVPDPVLHGPVQETTALTETVGRGLIFPLFDDDAATTGVLEFGDAAPAAAHLVNDGNTFAYPQIVVTGAMASGFDLQLTGDSSTGGSWGVTYAGGVYAAGDAVLVDMAGAVTVGGVDHSWALTRRDWAGVAPAGHVTATITPIVSGWGQARLTLRSAFL